MAAGLLQRLQTETRVRCLLASDGHLKTSTHLSMILEDHVLHTPLQGHRVSADVLHQLSRDVAVGSKDHTLEASAVR